MIRFRPHRLVAPCLALCLARGVAAASLQVAPVRVDLSRSATSAIVAVRNAGDEPVRLQLEVSDWTQDDQGKMELKPAKGLLLYPPLLELRPGEERNIRIGAPASDFGAREKSGRLTLQELPGSPRQNAPKQVRVTTRVSVPVFLAPDQRVEDLRLEGLKAADGAAQLVLTNLGTVSLRPVEVVVEALDAKGAQLGKQRWDGWYVLAGTVRNYAWAVPKEICGKVAVLQAAVQLEKKTLSARVQLAGGACAP